MQRTLICVAHCDGADGTKVARLVADQLGLRYVDEEIVTAAAQRAGAAPELVAEAEQRQPLLRRVLEEARRERSRRDGGYRRYSAARDRRAAVTTRRRAAALHCRCDRGDGCRGQRRDWFARRLLRPRRARRSPACVRHGTARSEGSSGRSTARN